MSNSRTLYKNKTKNKVNTPLFTTDYFRAYLGVIDETLLFQIKEMLVLKSNFEIKNNNVDPKGMNRIKQYLENLKHQILHEGSNVKGPEFIKCSTVLNILSGMVVG